jgi:hypothetical protein
MSELGAAYRAVRPKTRERVGELLGREGRRFDVELHEILQRTRLGLPGVPELALWMAHALAWAQYAAYDDDFMAAASDFLADGSAETLETATGFSQRFGPGRLRDALLAFRDWFTEMRRSFGAVTPDAARLKALQERSLQVVQRLKEDGGGRGVGLWLFAAPFKIMAVAHQGLWADEALAALLMPTGTQVNRALATLRADRVIQIESIVLEGGEGTFEDEYANLWTLQLPQRDLARAAGTSVLHVNSGLYQLGQGSE